jgi:RalA-binding protein 1
MSDLYCHGRANGMVVAIVFAPTLNIPAPLIQLFLTDYPAIFGEGIDEKQSPIKEITMTTPPPSDGIRSPRHQMFSDLPTPAYNQTGFGQAMPGFQPLAHTSQPTHRNTYSPHPQQYTNTNQNMATAIYNLQPGGPGEIYGNMDALGVPNGNSKKNRRESSMMGVNVGLINSRQTSRQTLRDTSNGRTSDKGQLYSDRGRDGTPERHPAPVPMY